MSKKIRQKKDKLSRVNQAIVRISHSVSLLAEPGYQM